MHLKRLRPIRIRISYHLKFLALILITLSLDLKAQDDNKVNGLFQLSAHFLQELSAVSNFGEKMGDLSKNLSRIVSNQSKVELSEVYKVFLKTEHKKISSLILFACDAQSNEMKEIALSYLLIDPFVMKSMTDEEINRLSNYFGEELKAPVGYEVRKNLANQTITVKTQLSLLDHKSAIECYKDLTKQFDSPDTTNIIEEYMECPPISQEQKDKLTQFVEFIMPLLDLQSCLMLKSITTVTTLCNNLELDCDTSEITQEINNLRKLYVFFYVVLNDIQQS